MLKTRNKYAARIMKGFLALPLLCGWVSVAHAELDTSPALSIEICDGMPLAQTLPPTIAVCEEYPLATNLVVQAPEIETCNKLPLQKDLPPTIAVCSGLPLATTDEPAPEVDVTSKRLFNDRNFVYVLWDNEATIVYYAADASGALEIPDTLGEYPVVAISPLAFSDALALTAITIPASVKSIGENAFQHCDRLTHIYFKGDAPSLERDAFGGIKSATVYRVASATGWSDLFGGLSVKIDSDLDGLVDSWEKKYFTEKTKACPSARCANGINSIEDAYIIGLDPTDASARFDVQAKPVPEGMEVQWNCEPGRLYTVLYSANLVDGFSPIATDIEYPTNSYINHTQNISGFYRVEVKLKP